MPVMAVMDTLVDVRGQQAPSIHDYKALRNDQVDHLSLHLVMGRPSYIILSQLTFSLFLDKRRAIHVSLTQQVYPGLVLERYIDIFMYQYILMH